LAAVAGACWGGSDGATNVCGGERMFLTRGSAAFTGFVNDPLVAGAAAAAGAVLAIAANAESIEAASGGFVGAEVGAGSIHELGYI